MLLNSICTASYNGRNIGEAKPSVLFGRLMQDAILRRYRAAALTMEANVGIDYVTYFTNVNVRVNHRAMIHAHYHPVNPLNIVLPGYRPAAYWGSGIATGRDIKHTEITLSRN